MSNINGKVYAMNVITPMKPWKTWILRGLFFVLGHVKPLQNDLINLSFIEFARWVILPRRQFPFLGKGQVKEDLKYDYLLFFSNFNGTWNQYIDAFSAVLSRGLNMIWRWSEKFPGSVQGIHRTRTVRHRLLLHRLSVRHGQRSEVGPHCAICTGQPRSKHASLQSRAVRRSLSKICPPGAVSPR